MNENISCVNCQNYSSALHGCYSMVAHNEISIALHLLTSRLPTKRITALCNVNSDTNSKTKQMWKCYRGYQHNSALLLYRTILNLVLLQSLLIVHKSIESVNSSVPIGEISLSFCCFFHVSATLLPNLSRSIFWVPSGDLEKRISWSSQKTLCYVRPGPFLSSHSCCNDAQLSSMPSAKGDANERARSWDRDQTIRTTWLRIDLPFWAR